MAENTAEIKTYTVAEMQVILEAHRKWRYGEEGGVWADLSGANLSGADLSGADLSRANLSRANLSRADLSGAALSWANLSGANLSGADLSGANLSGANLSGANLSGADLSGANLSGANLSGADLSGAALSGADLSGADLSGANLSRANLSGANLSGANLSRANLSRADLSWAKYGEDNLRGVIQIGPIGSRKSYLVVFGIGAEGFVFRAGCFTGNLDEFSTRVMDQHGDSSHAKNYLAAIEFARVALPAKPEWVTLPNPLTENVEVAVNV